MQDLQFAKHEVQETIFQLLMELAQTHEVVDMLLILQEHVGQMLLISFSLIFYFFIVLIDKFIRMRYLIKINIACTICPEGSFSNNPSNL